MRDESAMRDESPLRDDSANTDAVVTDSAPDEQHAAPAGHRRASGIYGTIVTASVLASAGGHLPTRALAVAAFVTLLVYWAAEEYAQVLAEQTAHGRLPTWRRIRSGLAMSWPMVSSAYLPVLTLVIARVVGASNVVSANIALSVTVILLVIHGWAAGRAAELRGIRLLIVTLIAGGLGVLMIILKNLVLTNLH